MHLAQEQALHFIINLKQTILFLSFKPGYWGLSRSSRGCKACECDVGGSYERNCEQLTGQCRCRTSITGRRCDQVVDGNYFPLPDHLKYESEEAKIIGVCLKCKGLLSNETVIPCPAEVICSEEAALSSFYGGNLTLCQLD